MTAPWMVQGWVVGATLLVVAITIVLHYEALLWMAKRFGGRDGPLQRHLMLAVICGLLALHVAEIGLFGSAYWLLLKLPGSGGITGADDPAGIFDALYLSAVTYTTVGFGDLAPVGAIRFMAATEALIGLMMVTWSASFTYLEMIRHWRRR